MLLMIGYKGESLIRQEDGKVFVQVDDKENAEGCRLATAEGEELMGNPRPRSHKTIYIGKRGGILTVPAKDKKSVPRSKMCPYTIPMEFAA